MTNLVGRQFDRLAAQYSTKYDRPRTAFDYEKLRRREILLREVDQLSVHSALDIGCGSGQALRSLGERFADARLCGVDLSASMLRTSQAAQTNQVSLAQSLADRLPFADHSFDLVFALGLVDYLKDPAAFFQEVARVLQPQGTFVFTFPNHDSISRRLRNARRAAEQHCARLLNRHRPKTVAQALSGSQTDRLARTAGLEINQRFYITYRGGLADLPCPILASRSLERWIGQHRLARHLAWSCVCVARPAQTIYPRLAA